MVRTKYNIAYLGVAVAVVTAFALALISLGATWWQVLICLALAYLIQTLVLLWGDRQEAAIAHELLERIGQPFPMDIAADSDLSRTTIRVRTRPLSAWIALHEDGVIVHRPFRMSCLVPNRLLNDCPVVEGKGGAKWCVLYAHGKDRLRILDTKGILAAARKHAPKPTR